jgi:hypothetical protein
VQIIFAPKAATASCTTSANVFINEIHYDNTGTDIGEKIEVAGTAGIDLSEYMIVLYNGSTGTDYSSKTLTGILPNQSNGFGVLSFSFSQIENGGPDGIALVHVVQFLSYEGTFTASDGPAVGFSSTDIGVTEPNNTPVGHSLQLGGTGNSYADFTWGGAATNTFGAINGGQTITPCPSNGPSAPHITRSSKASTKATKASTKASSTKAPSTTKAPSNSRRELGKGKRQAELKSVSFSFADRRFSDNEYVISCYCFDF